MDTSKAVSLALLVLFAGPLTGCGGDQPDPQPIVDRGIEAHGGKDQLDGTVLQFDFRDRRFRLLHDEGLFRYERTFPDSSVAIHDVLTNDSVYRNINGEPVELSDQLRSSITSGINSVAYFALLPFKLNDPAVRKRYLGADSVRDQPYNKVEITFREEGGGAAHEDRFVYWFHRDRHTMDYFAYAFAEDGGGTRFREAVRPRHVGGLLFVDYLNYTSHRFPSPGDSIEHFDRALEQGDVQLLSEINLENISVEPIATE